MTETDIDLSQIAKAHINLRDARAELRKKFDEEDGKLKEAQARLEAVLLDHLNRHNLQSIRTPVGTIYKQEDVTPSASDWNIFYDWIKEFDAWEALERRIKKTFVKEYQEAHNGGLPPGISVYRENVVRVRRGS